MRISDLRRFAIGYCAGVVELAGCAGGTSLSPSPGGPPTALMATSAEPTHSNPRYKVLYSFAASGDAANPYAGLINVNGIFYGTTAYGGANGDGTVFSVAPSGAETVLYSFKGGSGDGNGPLADLIKVKGMLYGTTMEGGANGDGTVFSITPSGTEAVLYSFKGGSGDGQFPLAGLIDVNGKLYGTTVYGATSDDGTIFSITPSGTERVLYGFKAGSGDGEKPYAGLINVKGTLYGTTHLGGANGDGTIFSISPSHVETVIYSFKGGSGDGEYPYAGLVNVKGTLYGTTIEGGANGVGTVFSTTTSGRETALHSFGGSGDGQYPYYGGLVDVKGKLYGTTYYGGADGNGTVFRLLP